MGLFSEWDLDQNGSIDEDEVKILYFKMDCNDDLDDVEQAWCSITITHHWLPTDLSGCATDLDALKGCVTVPTEWEFTADLHLEYLFWAFDFDTSGGWSEFERDYLKGLVHLGHIQWWAPGKSESSFWNSCDLDGNGVIYEEELYSCWNNGKVPDCYIDQFDDEFDGMWASINADGDDVLDNDEMQVILTNLKLVNNWNRWGESGYECPVLP